MKIKKLISAALVLVLAFGFVVGAMPITAGAVYIPDDEVETLSSDEIDKLIEKTIEYNYSSAAEMLAAELAAGYLVRADFGTEYTIYVNRYTGILYYVNNYTGQILTSNPYDPYYYKDGSTDRGMSSDTDRMDVMSQIILSISDIATGDPKIFNSMTQAAAEYQISVQRIADGLRVNYTLGDTSVRYLVPGRIGAEDFEKLIIYPVLERISAALEADFDEADFENGMHFLDNDNYVATNLGYINSSTKDGLVRYLDDTLAVIEGLNNDGEVDATVYSNVKTLISDLKKLVRKFNLKNPAAYDESSSAYKNMIRDYYTPKSGQANLKVFEDLTPMYVVVPTTLASNVQMSELAILFQKYATNYTYSQMYEDEETYGHVNELKKTPVVRCAIEYTFAEDGSLEVRLPANSITFDETLYTLDYIIPVPYFGAGDMTKEGYAFYPDGSGAISSFADFYTDADPVRITINSSVSGRDYAYSNITGTRGEQITMPVYGIVNETNGYFAILEEGASLASLVYKTGGTSSKYAWAYCEYKPYPQDKYDLSETISVGGSKDYTIVADSKYNGSYITRFVMLTDDETGTAVYGEGNYYAASYVGMANYYRQYLVSNGSLTQLTDLGTDMPLYIQALGSMEIIKKILSFPITTKLELTTFNDVLTIYRELSDAKNIFKQQGDSFKALADATEDEEIKAAYLESANEYYKLSEDVDNITNINFRLTGFGNGGLYYTYPTKVRWDRACGGSRAFNNLVAEAKKISSEAGKTLGIYPDYDFMYITNTEIFDGIVIKGNVSRMVDNRYASKQIYDSVLQDYESDYALVINPASLDKIYTKFAKQYSKYDIQSISVSTLGSDLNSNFDEKESINRDDAENFVVEMLERMTGAGYDVMADKGNAFALKYFSHLLNVTLDSSHYRYASYAVPFVGMILHGKIQYAGNPINYSGSPASDLLRAIENGASLQYILCYQNSSYLKEDEILSDYYGVDYETWYEDIVKTYTELNTLIGGLQEYTIVNHQVVIGERVIDDDEVEADRDSLKREIADALYTYVYNKVAEGYDALKGSSAYGTDLKVTFNRDTLMAQFADIINVTVTELEGTAFADEIDDIIAYYTGEYASTDDNAYVVNISTLEYTSKYSFTTDSLATDKDYVYTNYTSDIDNIVIVTYQKGDDVVKFILNYNIYSVTVNLGAEGTYTLGKYGYAVVGKE